MSNPTAGLQVSGTALVTGAGRGIGQALTIALSAAGMRVGLLGRDRAALLRTAEACAVPAGQVLAAEADVTDETSLRTAVNAIEAQLGPVDLLVNNAAVADLTEAPPWEADPAAWWSVVTTNLMGPFLACHVIMPGMVRRGRGRVVNLNSGMGLRPSPGYSAYSVSKAALARLTSCLAAAGADDGVSVFDVSPGYVHTDLTARMPALTRLAADQWSPVERVQQMVVQIATGRLDALSGCYLHAVHDDLDDLLGRACEIRRSGARTLSLRPYGPGDPVVPPNSKEES